MAEEKKPWDQETFDQKMKESLITFENGTAKLNGQVWFTRIETISGC